MNVVSVDPAPSKDAVVFDGRYHTVPASELVAHCASLSKDPDTLLCWDAPLTGPESSTGSFSQRTIEQFFSRQATGYKTPKGISVLPYSGCPHWAITRACLGLPICGEYSAEGDELPFALTTDATEITSGRAQVLETHPAVAIWLWYRKVDGNSKADPDKRWSYKGKNPSRTVEELWESLSEIWQATGNPTIQDAIARTAPPKDDDRLDAFVGWVLGTLLASDDSSVEILGDSNTGAIALPVTPGLQTQFNAFIKGGA